MEKDEFPGLFQWLANGERGISSEAIAETITGVQCSRWMGFSNHPVDPDDFKRCELLLRQVPALRLRLHEMEAASAQWARLIGRWQEIVTTLETEIPGVFDGETGTAPIADRLIRHAIAPPSAEGD